MTEGQTQKIYINPLDIRGKEVLRLVMTKRNSINPNRIKSKDIYESKNGNITLKEIAETLGEKLSNIKYWKREDKWKGDKRGAPKGNKNAVGNSGGHAPKGNINNLKDGKYRKYLPKTEQELLAEFKKKGYTEADLLREQILIAHARFAVNNTTMGVDEVVTSGLKIAKMTEKLHKITGESVELDNELKKAKINNLNANTKAIEFNIQANSKESQENKINMYMQLLENEFSKDKHVIIPNGVIEDDI